MRVPQPDTQQSFVPHRLSYRKGDLVIKEGDYGISIYKIIKGKVLIYSESEGMEIFLATLGEGEIIGEMLFLEQSIERRSASVRAVEDSEVEVWHPSMLAQEYEKMPPVIKHLANQALSRLVRMNKMLVQLRAKRQKAGEGGSIDLKATNRLFYRKEVRMQFNGQQVNSSARRVLSGNITNVSLAGVGMEVHNTNMYKNPFRADDEFFIKTVLPNKKEMEFQAKLVSMKEGTKPMTMILSMTFTELTDLARANLGFFLMS